MSTNHLIHPPPFQIKWYTSLIHSLPPNICLSHKIQKQVGISQAWYNLPLSIQYQHWKYTQQFSKCNCPNKNCYTLHIDRASFIHSLDKMISNQQKTEMMKKNEPFCPAYKPQIEFCTEDNSSQEHLHMIGILFQVEEVIVDLAIS